MIKNIALILCMAFLCAAATKAQTTRVGYWNLKRTFGPKGTVVSRTQSETQKLAEIVKRMKSDAMILSNVSISLSKDLKKPISKEVEELCRNLGKHWQFSLSSQVGAKSIALIFDAKRVSLKSTTTINTPMIEVQGLPVFKVKPTVFWIAAITNEKIANDTLLVGLDLGELTNRVHNRMCAISMLLSKLSDEKWRLKVKLPKASKERDTMIMGTFASTSHKKQRYKFLFDYIEGTGLRHLGTGREGRIPVTTTGSLQLDHIFASPQLFENAIDEGSLYAYTVPKNQRKLYARSISRHFPLVVDLTTTSIPK